VLAHAPEREVHDPVVDLVTGGHGLDEDQGVVDQGLQEEDHDQRVGLLIWTVKDSMSPTWTVTPPKGTWKLSSLNLDHWKRYGWLEVFPVLRSWSLNSKKMPMRLVELLTVKTFAEEGSG